MLVTHRRGVDLDHAQMEALRLLVVLPLLLDERERIKHDGDVRMLATE